MRQDLLALKRVGVPYSEEAIAAAIEDLLAQATPDADTAPLNKRYPKVQFRDFDGDPSWSPKWTRWSPISQMLGTPSTSKRPAAGAGQVSYDAFRHFADSWGLVFMGVMWVSFIGWAFLPRNRDCNREAANMIFEDSDNG